MDMMATVHEANLILPHIVDYKQKTWKAFHDDRSLLYSPVAKTKGLHLDKTTKNEYTTKDAKAHLRSKTQLQKKNIGKWGSSILGDCSYLELIIF